MTTSEAYLEDAPYLAGPLCSMAPTMLAPGEKCPPSTFRTTVLRALRESEITRAAYQKQYGWAGKEAFDRAIALVEDLQAQCPHTEYHKTTPFRVDRGPFAGRRVVWCAVCNKALKALETP